MARPWTGEEFERAVAEGWFGRFELIEGEVTCGGQPLAEWLWRTLQQRLQLREAREEPSLSERLSRLEQRLAAMSDVIDACDQRIADLARRLR